jgi:hypothetical protein
VQVVKFPKLPINRENPYASLSPEERYACGMSCLAEVWAAICRRKGADTKKEQRKAA